MNSDNNFKCSICFKEVVEDEIVLKCDHKYHKHCIEKWFRKQSFCPLCRYSKRIIEGFNEMYYEKICNHNGCRLNHNFCCKCLDMKSNWIQFNKSKQKGDPFMHYCETCYDFSCEEYSIKSLLFEFPPKIDSNLEKKLKFNL